LTPIFAFVGTLLGIVNIAITIWQWRRSGPTVRAELCAGWQTAGGGVLVFPVAGFDATMPPEDQARAVVGVAVTNRGRSAVDVTAWWINVGAAQIGMVARIDAATIEETRSLGLALRDLIEPGDFMVHQLNEHCPFRLDGHARRNWLLSMREVASAAHALTDKTDIRVSATVHLGNGKTIHTKEKVPIRVLGAKT
jgi:hypothetical protein